MQVAYLKIISEVLWVMFVLLAESWLLLKIKVVIEVNFKKLLKVIVRLIIKLNNLSCFRITQRQKNNLITIYLRSGMFPLTLFVLFKNQKN